MTEKTADPRELAKFEAMTESWWDPEGDFRPLHDLNPLRLAFIESHAPLDGLQVLDVGCGAGLLSEGMALRGADVIGIDLAGGPIEAARAHAADAGVEVDYRLLDAETMAAEAPGSFDVVTCLELLEHVPDPPRIIAACAAAAKPGGRVFFSTLNRTLRAFGLGIIGAEYLLGLLPRGTHHYAKFIRPSELAAAARACGLEAVELKGLQYNPMSRKTGLSDDVAVNYIACFEKGL